MKWNIWHLVTFLIGYILGKDHVDLSAILFGLIGGLLALRLLGWMFKVIFFSADVSFKFFNRPFVVKIASIISYLIAFIFTHWMLIFISLVLAVPITFLSDSILSGVDTATTLIATTAILFPVVEILYHIQFRKKKRQIFGFDV